MARHPPGPRGEPVFGSSRRYARDPFAFLSAIESAYGSVARFQMGPLDTYAVTDPAAIERILVSDSDHVRKPDFQDDALGELLGDGLLLSAGDTWAAQRELANPTFAGSRLTPMADRITDHAQSLVAEWTPGDVIDVERAMTRVTIAVITDLMLGVELDEATIAHVQDQLEPVGARFEPNPIRFALPASVPLPGDREYREAIAALESVIEDLVTRRRQTLSAGNGEPTDFLARLIRGHERGELTHSHVRDEVMTVLLAGHDTTALALTYTWYLLSEHPAAARVRAEVDSVLDGERPGSAHVQAFEYTEWAIREAMRLYPPVYTIFRTPTRPIEVDGYTVPEGATIMLPQWAVHRSDRHWQDPAAFDPERWAPERTADRHQFAYFPFGGGPRICIGKHLAMLEAQLIVATIARSYRLEYLGNTPPALRPTLTVHPATTMSMRVTRRDGD